MTTVLPVSSSVIDLLLAEAAVLRRSYLGLNGEVMTDDATRIEKYRQADLFDDLAEHLLPHCDPPRATLARPCKDCHIGTLYRVTMTLYPQRCIACRGTKVWPPIINNVRLRLLPPHLSVCT
jgi:hypothetical protein